MAACYTKVLSLFCLKIIDTFRNDMCNWVLDSSKVEARADTRHLTSELHNLISHTLLVTHGRPLFEEGWQGIHAFKGIIEKCVGVIGHHPYIYSDLLVMLDSIGSSFLPEPGLTWLSLTISRIADASTFWTNQQNGIRTANLLSRGWTEQEQTIRNNKDSLYRYSQIVDMLVAGGIPLASQLQQQLENRR